MGLPDADIALGIQGTPALPAGLAVGLTFNGVALTTENVKNGTYSFWGNEFLYQSLHNLSTGGGTVYTSLLSAIPLNCDDVYYIATGNMHANKTLSSSDPTHY